MSTYALLPSGHVAWQQFRRSGIHKLTGNVADFRSVTVTPNYWLIVRFKGGDSYEVNYVDYQERKQLGNVM